MAPSEWATQQLAEFLAVLTAAADERAAIADTLERLAESFDAEAGAFVQMEQVTCSIGWAAGYDNAAELRAVVAGNQAVIELPGVGPCHTVVLPVNREGTSAVVLARAGHRFSAEEVGLLRGMARVLSIGLQLLATAAVEHRQAQENAKLLASLRERQGLLERLSWVQRQISKRAPLPEVLQLITAVVRELLGDQVVALLLVDEADPGSMETVSCAGAPALLERDLRRSPAGLGIAGQSISKDELCTMEAAPGGAVVVALPGPALLRSGMAAPVHLEGRPAGSLVVAAPRPATSTAGRRRISSPLSPNWPASPSTTPGRCGL